MFGPGCGIDDIEAIANANQLCDAYGLDTIQTVEPDKRGRRPSG